MDARTEAAVILGADPRVMAVWDSPAGPVAIYEPTPSVLRTTPARPLRVRVCTERVDGPAWLTLLCQCAWLRGGIVGSAGLPAEG